MHNCVYQVIIYTFLVHILIFPVGIGFLYEETGGEDIAQKVINPFAGWEKPAAA